MTRAASLVLFVAAFVATAATVRSTTPDQLPKLDYFTAHRDEYDIVFVGTSEVLFHIEPSLFDADLRAAGFACRSFNYGLGALTVTEMLATWRAIDATGPARLRYVLVDISATHDVKGENRVTRRNVYAHSLGATEATWAALSASPLSPRAKLARMAVDVAPLAHHLLGTGLIAAAIERGLSADVLRDPLAVGDGFVSVATRLPADWPGRAAWPGLVAGARPGAVDDSPIGVFRGAMLDRVVAEVRATGRTPLVYRAPRLERLPPMTGGAPLFDYADPAVAPELFAVEHRWDEAHLNDEGAHLLTHRLAGDFAAWLKLTGQSCAVR